VTKAGSCSISSTLVTGIVSIGEEFFKHMTSSNGYFVVEQGQRQGPFDLAVLQSKVREGTLSDATLLWTDGMADWQPARSVLPEIFANTAGSSAIAQIHPDPIASSGPQPLVIAHFGGRVLAAIIDICLVLGAMQIVLVPAGIATFLTGFLGELFYPVVAGIYSALMISSEWQATSGKKILGLKVVISPAHDLPAIRAGAAASLRSFPGRSLASATCFFSSRLAGRICMT